MCGVGGRWGEKCERHDLECKCGLKPVRARGGGVVVPCVYGGPVVRPACVSCMVCVCVCITRATQCLQGCLSACTSVRGGTRGLGGGSVQVGCPVMAACPGAMQWLVAVSAVNSRHVLLSVGGEAFV